MAVQEQYLEEFPAGVEGAIADTQHRVLISRTVEGDAIGFGVPVVQGANDYGIRATAAGDTADDLVGIVVRDQTTFDDEFKVGESARVATTVTVWVKTVAAVSAGDEVHVIVADGTFSNTGGVVYPGARFNDSGAADALVRIRLN